MAYQYDEGVASYHSQVIDRVEEILPEVIAWWDKISDFYAFTWRDGRVEMTTHDEESATLVEFGVVGDAIRPTGSHVKLEYVYPEITAAVIVGLLATLTKKEKTP